MTKFEVSLVGGDSSDVKFEADSIHFREVNLMALSLVGDTVIVQVWGNTIDHIVITYGRNGKVAWLVAKEKEIYGSANGTPEIIWRQKEIK